MDITKVGSCGNCGVVLDSTKIKENKCPVCKIVLGFKKL